MINYKFSYLLDITSNKSYSFDEAMKLTNMSKNELISQINQIQNKLNNDWLILKKDNFICLPLELKKNWEEFYYEILKEDVIFSENERKMLIYLITYSSFEELSVFHYQEFFQVSRGTILGDIKRLRGELLQSNISLEYTRKQGFFLKGNEAHIRKVSKKYLADILETKVGKWGALRWINQHDMILYAEVKDCFTSTIRNNALTVVPSRLDELSLFISYTLQRMDMHPIKEIEDKDLLQSLIAYKASQMFLQKFNKNKIRSFDNESCYLTVLFMSILQGEIQDTSLDFLLDCSKKIISEMERLAVMEFKDVRKLLIQVFYHLVPAYFRIKYESRLSNVLIREIKEEYGELFKITQLALKPLEELTGKKIHDEEIGYFTILFGGEIGNQRENERSVKYKALILCPNGISSSLIMKSELKNLFPTINFIETSSINQLQCISENDYDVIFSSIPIQSDKKVYIIKPIMTQIEKNLLMKQVQEDLLIPGITIFSIDEMLELILPHVNLKEGVTKEKLYKILNKKLLKTMKEKEDERPMLTELLTKEMIQFSDAKLAWEEAIELAATPLKGEKINDSYVEAMIDRVNEYGPFIHIGKGIALPHARPENGVKQIGMSLLKVKEPVLLLDDEKHQINIFICLAAIDNETHLRALSSLTRLLSNSEKLDELLKADNTEKVLDILKEGEE